MIFGNVKDKHGLERRERVPVARSLSARVLRSALCANHRQMSPAFKAINFQRDRIARFTKYLGVRLCTR